MERRTVNAFYLCGLQPMFTVYRHTALLSSLVRYMALHVPS